LASDEFYRALGFGLCRGGEEATFTSLRAGASYLNLIAQPARRQGGWWGRVIFHVTENPLRCWLGRKAAWCAS
jgi:hypothetical protein